MEKTLVLVKPDAFKGHRVILVYIISNLFFAQVGETYFGYRSETTLPFCRCQAYTGKNFMSTPRHSH